jgi:hypothetical protein
MSPVSPSSVMCLYHLIYEERAPLLEYRASQPPVGTMNLPTGIAEVKQCTYSTLRIEHTLVLLLSNWVGIRSRQDFSEQCVQLKSLSFKQLTPLPPTSPTT